MGIRAGWMVLAFAVTAGFEPACGQGSPGLPDVTYSMKEISISIAVPEPVDILMVIDDSGSMAGMQALLVASMKSFVRTFVQKFQGEKVHLAILTTGMDSESCQPCAGSGSIGCLNDTGETGRFQDRIGHITFTGGNPSFDFTEDASCRVVTADNLNCLFDPAAQSGTAIVGIDGCRLGRGLSAVKRALQPDLLGGYNAGFLRDDAVLAIFVISAGEDCGEPGDVSEGIAGIDQRICSYAASGIGPDGLSFYADDPAQKPYALAPVDDTYDFLTGLKGNRDGMVKFAAIVGVKDLNDLDSTTIGYEGTEKNSAVTPACFFPGCTGDACGAMPGTRYIQLAKRFGLGKNGMVDTICQDNFFATTMSYGGGFVACPRLFKLSDPVRDPALMAIQVNGQLLPKYSCAHDPPLEACQGPGSSCSAGDCVESWTYSPPTTPPDYGAPGGEVAFAAHLDPCTMVTEGTVQIDLTYVTD